MDYPSGLFSSSRVIRVEMAVTIFNDFKVFRALCVPCGADAQDRRPS
jgi:hypothetical protein